MEKFKQNLLGFGGMALVFLLLLISCQKKPISIDDNLIFRYNETANITSLDPAFAKDLRNIWVSNQLYNTLVQLDDELQIKPDLAESWEISEDGLTYTFHLRKDVFFHENKIFGNDSTRMMNAADVVYSLNRLVDPKLASPGSWVMREVESVEKIDDFTVKIQLIETFPAFLGILSMTYCSVLPVEMEKLNFLKEPIGTGPFKFKRWQTNEKLVFRKNELYFEKDDQGNQLPYMEAVAITFLQEKQGEFMQFALGNLDFMSGLDVAYKDELLTPEGNLQAKYEEIIKVEKAPYLNVEYIGLYLDDDSPEMKSIKFRQALNYGFDRNSMITYLRNGIGLPAENGFIPQGLPGFSENQFYTWQPEKARGLIKEWQAENNGIQPKIKIATTAQYLEYCEFLQREWQKIGVAVDVDVMPASTLLQMRSAGQLQTFRASWIADYPDAQNYLSLFYSKNFSPAGPNYTHFHSVEYDSIYEQSFSISNPEERAVLYRQMDSIIMSQAPVVPLYYDQVVRFTRQNVDGLGINPQNLLDLRRVRKR